MITKEIKADLDLLKSQANSVRANVIEKQMKLAGYMNSGQFDKLVSECFSKEEVDSIIKSSSEYIGFKGFYGQGKAIANATVQFKEGVMKKAIFSEEAAKFLTEEVQSILGKYLHMDASGQTPDLQDPFNKAIFEYLSAGDDAVHYKVTQTDYEKLVITYHPTVGEDTIIEGTIDHNAFDAWITQHVLVQGDHLEFAE